MVYRLWGCRNWQPLFISPDSAPLVDKITRYRQHKFLQPVPRYPTGTPGYRYLQGTGIKDTLFNIKDPPCSLLMLTNIIYNCVFTGRGFYLLEGVGLAFIEEHKNRVNLTETLLSWVLVLILSLFESIIF